MKRHWLLETGEIRTAHTHAHAHANFIPPAILIIRAVMPMGMKRRWLRRLLETGEIRTAILRVIIIRAVNRFLVEMARRWLRRLLEKEEKRTRSLLFS